MHGIRATRAFDGHRWRPDGALVLIERGRIVGVESGHAPAPAEAEVDDVPGALLPGLVDAHVHLCGDGREGALDRLETYDDAELSVVIEEGLRSSLATGVTTVRDLGDRRFAVVAWRDAGKPGWWPTVLAAGPPLTSIGGHCWNMGGEVSGEVELRAAVAERAERGVDVVKIMASGGFTTVGSNVVDGQFTDHELEVVVTEAHRLGLPITAHAHPLVAVEQSIRAGVDGIEHGTGMTEHGLGLPEPTVGRLRREAITVCPTLGQTTVLTPPPAIRDLLHRRGLTPELVMSTAAEQAARLLAAGVRIISGSDAGVGSAKPHGMMAISLEALVRGGADPVAALTSATALAAESIGLGARKGRIAAGYDADFVIVDGDPHRDIADLRSVRRVYLAGKQV